MQRHNKYEICSNLKNNIYFNYIFNNSLGVYFMRCNEYDLKFSKIY